MSARIQRHAFFANSDAEMYRAKAVAFRRAWIMACSYRCPLRYRKWLRECMRDAAKDAVRMVRLYVARAA